MNRHDGVFHFRYWTSKTDHYTKSYPDFSLGGDSNSGTQFTCRIYYIIDTQSHVVHRVAPEIVVPA